MLEYSLDTQASRYGTCGGKDVFQYAHKQDASLTQLRQEYRIDTKATGKGSFDTVLTLMDWVHHTLFVQESHLFPLIHLAKRERCFVFLIRFLMNEALLSIGHRQTNVPMFTLRHGLPRISYGLSAGGD